MKTLSFEPFAPERAELLRCLGYGPDAAPGVETEQMLAAMVNRIPELGQMKGAFTTLPVSGITETGVQTPTGFIESQRLAVVAEGAAAVAFGLVTVGEAIDLCADQSPDMVEACLWDALGTALAEQAVNRLLDEIGTQTGQTVSLPFSPGYCDWKLPGQAVIFSAFGENPLGINLYPDSFVMTPRKSISFVACLGASESCRNPCRYCKLKNCFMRRS